MQSLKQVKAWNWLKGEIAKLTDPNVKLAFRHEFEQCALQNWGWVPENNYRHSAVKKIELDDWEREFLRDIRLSIKYGVYIREEKSIQEREETRRQMLLFVRKGGYIEDIPEDYRPPAIVKLYFECMHEIGEELINQLDYIIANAS